MDENLLNEVSLLLGMSRKDLDKLRQTDSGLQSIHKGLINKGGWDSSTDYNDFSGLFRLDNTSQKQQKLPDAYGIIGEALGRSPEDIYNDIASNPTKKLTEYKTLLEEGKYLDKMTDKDWADLLGYDLTGGTQKQQKTTKIIKDEGDFKYEEDETISDKVSGINFKDFQDLSKQVVKKEDALRRLKNEAAVYGKAKPPTVANQFSPSFANPQDFTGDISKLEKELSTLKDTQKRADKSGLRKTKDRQISDGVSLVTGSPISAKDDQIIDFNSGTITPANVREFNKKVSDLEDEVKRSDPRTYSVNAGVTAVSPEVQENLNKKKKELEDFKTLRKEFVRESALISTDDYINNDEDLVRRAVATGGTARDYYEQASANIDEHKAVQIEAQEDIAIALKNKYGKRIAKFYDESDKLSAKEEDLTQADVDAYKSEFADILADKDLQALNDINRNYSRTSIKESSLLSKLEEVDKDGYDIVQSIDAKQRSKDVDYKDSSILDRLAKWPARGVASAWGSLTGMVGNSFQPYSGEPEILSKIKQTAKDVLLWQARDARDYAGLNPLSSRATAGISDAATFTKDGKLYKAIYKNGKVTDVRDEQDFSVGTESLLTYAKDNTSEKDTEKDISWYSVVNSSIDAIRDIGVDAVITRRAGSILGGTKRAYAIGQGMAAFSRGYSSTYDEMIRTPGMSVEGANFGATVMGVAASQLSKINPIESEFAEKGLNKFFSKYVTSNAKVLATGKITTKDILADYLAYLGEAGVSMIKEPLEEVPELFIQNYGVNPILNKIHGTELAAHVDPNELIETTLVSAISGSIGAGLPNSRRSIRNKAIDVIAGSTSTFIDFASGLASSNPDMADNLNKYIAVAKELETLAPDVKDEKARVEILKDMLKVQEGKEMLSKITISTAVDAKKEQVKSLENGIIEKIAKYSEKNIKKVRQLEDQAVGRDTGLTAFDFDSTLFEGGKLTTIGQEVKKRIAAGENIKIITARDADDTQQIKGALGITDSSIVATGDESLKRAKIDELGIAPTSYYDADQAKLDAIRAGTPVTKNKEDVSNKSSQVIPDGTALRDVESIAKQELDADKLNKEAGVDIYVARQEIESGGNKYYLSQIKENNATNTFLIEDANGNEIGKAQLSKDGNFLENIRIDEKHRRKGLASKVYDFIELRKGIELEPSPNKQSKEAKALWDKRNLQKSVSNKANGGLLAKALGESMSKAFSDFRKKQEVLVELENRYFKQKGLSKEDFNKLSESDKADVIKDAVKWKNENPEIVAAVESLLTKEQEPPTGKSPVANTKEGESSPSVSNEVPNFKHTSKAGVEQPARDYIKNEDGTWSYKLKNGTISKPIKNTSLEKELNKALFTQQQTTDEKESSSKDDKGKSKTRKSGESQVDSTLDEKEKVGESSKPSTESEVETMLEEIGKTRKAREEQIYKFFALPAALGNESKAREIARVTNVLWENVAKQLGKRSGKTAKQWIQSRVAMLGRVPVKGGLGNNLKNFFNDAKNKHKKLYKKYPDFDFIISRIFDVEGAPLDIKFQADKEYTDNEFYNDSTKELFGGKVLSDLNNEQLWMLHYLKKSNISPKKFKNEDGLKFHIESEINRIESEVNGGNLHIMQEFTSDDAQALADSYGATGNADRAMMLDAVKNASTRKEILKQTQDRQKNSFNNQLNHFREDVLPIGAQLVVLESILKNDYRLVTEIDIDGRKGNLDTYKNYLKSQGKTEVEIDQVVSDATEKGLVTKKYDTFKRKQNTINAFHEFDFGDLDDALSKPRVTNLAALVNSISANKVVDNTFVEKSAKYKVKNLSNGAKLFKIPKGDLSAVDIVVGYSEATKEVMTSMPWCTNGKGKAESVITNGDVYYVLDKDGKPIIQVTYNSDGSLEQLGGVGGNQSIRISDAEYVNEIGDAVPELESEFYRVKRDKFLYSLTTNGYKLSDEVTKDDVKWLLLEAKKGDKYNSITPDYKKFIDTVPLEFIADVLDKAVGKIARPADKNVNTAEVILGDLDINPNVTVGDLSNLKIVTGNLYINSDVGDLSNLQSVTGTLYINSDVTVGDLSNLQSVGGDLIIYSKVGDLSKLQSVGGNLDIFSDVTVGDLSNLKIVTGTLYINSDVGDLSNLQSVGGKLTIKSNVGDLSKLQSVGRNLDIKSNVTVGDLSNLQSVGGSLNIGSDDIKKRVEAAIANSPIKDKTVYKRAHELFKDSLKSGDYKTDYKHFLDVVVKGQGNVRFQVVGEKGATALDAAQEATTRLENLVVARDMEAAGKDAKTIKLATGWEKSVDGKWRYEIGDGKLVDGVNFSKEGLLLEDVIDHPDLFKSYPEIRNLKVKLFKDKGDEAYLDPVENTLYINEKKINEDTFRNNLRGIIEHELAHWVQDSEGFASGGNPRSFLATLLAKINTNRGGVSGADKRLPTSEAFTNAFERAIQSDRFRGTFEQLAERGNSGTLAGEDLNSFNKDLKNLAFDMYESLAGEVEAARVQQRVGLSDKQRRESLLAETTDVAREDQIIIMQSFDNLASSNSPAKNVSESNAAVETRDGDVIGFNYNTDKLARERFNIPELKKIGSGSDRDVYDLGDGKVLKVAKTARGLTQNIYEGDGVLSGVVTPEASERGLNYVVVENIPNAKTSNKVTTYDWDGNEIGETTLGEMLKDFSKFSQNDFDRSDSNLHDTVAKYGMQDVLSYNVLWGDFVAKRNWGYKDGKAIHSDAGTFGGVEMITSFRGVKNLSDPEFRQIYEDSKKLKKKFGDTDRNTMYQAENTNMSLEEATDRINNNLIPAIDLMIKERSDKESIKAKGFTKAQAAQQIKDLEAIKTELQRNMKDARFQVDAYHGTPYIFDRFTTDKIGTGEGSQVFGWGLYFTDLKGIAEGYAEKLSEQGTANYTLDGKALPEVLAPYLYDSRTKKKDLITDIDNAIKSNKSLLPNSKGFPQYDRLKAENEGLLKAKSFLLGSKSEIQFKPSRNLYKVALHKGKTPSEYTWLEWDNKIPKNTAEKIVNAIISVHPKDFSKTYMDYNEDIHIDSEENLIKQVTDMTGRELYRALHDRKYYFLFGNFYDISSTPKEASLFLLENGIDGIKYPAESISHGATSDTARGFNYVVFDENVVTIEERVQFQQEAAIFRAAAIEVANNQVLLVALDAPNESSFAHEMAHTFEQDLTEDEKQTFIDEYNEKFKEKGKDWNTDVSEYFARVWEKYLSNGRKLTASEVKDTKRRAKLQEVFDKFTEYLKGIYNGVIEYNNTKGVTKPIEVSPAAQAVFDRVMGIKEGSSNTPISEESPTTPEEESQTFKDAFKVLGEGFMDFVKTASSGGIGIIFDPLQEREKMSAAEKKLIGALISFVKSIKNITVASLKKYLQSDKFKKLYGDTLEISDEGLRFLIDSAKEPVEEPKTNTQQFRKRIIGDLTGKELKTNNLKDEEFDQLVEAKYEDIIADVEAGTVDLTQLLKDLLGDIDLLANTKDQKLGQGWQLGVVAKLANYYRENRDTKNFTTASNYLSAVSSNLGGIFRLLNTKVMGKYLPLLKATQIGNKFIASLDTEVTPGVTARNLAASIKDDIGLTVEAIIAKLPKERVSDFVKDGIKAIKKTERYKKAVEVLTNGSKGVKLQQSGNQQFDAQKDIARLAFEEAKGNYTKAKALFKYITQGIVANPAEAWANVLADKAFMQEQSDNLQKEIDRRVAQRLKTKPPATSDPLALFVDAIMRAKPKARTVNPNALTKDDIRKAIDEVATLYTDPLKRSEVRAALEDKLGAMVVGGVGRSNIRKKIREYKDLIKEVMESRASRDFLDLTLAEELIADHGLDTEEAMYLTREVKKIISSHIDSLTEKQKQNIFLKSLGIDKELIEGTITDLEDQISKEKDDTSRIALEAKLRIAKKSLADINKNTKRYLARKRSIDNMFQILKSGELSDQDIMASFGDRYNLLTLSIDDISQLSSLIDTINNTNSPVLRNQAIVKLTRLVSNKTKNLATIDFTIGMLFAQALSSLNTSTTAIISASTLFLTDIAKDIAHTLGQTVFNFVSGKSNSFERMRLVGFAIKVALKTAAPIAKNRVKLIFAGGVLSPDQKLEDFKAESDLVDPVYAKVYQRLTRDFKGSLPTMLIEAVSKMASAGILGTILMGKLVAVADALVAPFVYNYTLVKEEGLRDIRENEETKNYEDVIVMLNEKFKQRAKELEDEFGTADPNDGTPIFSKSEINSNVMQRLHEERLEMLHKTVDGMSEKLLKENRAILGSAQTTANLFSLTGPFTGIAMWPLAKFAGFGGDLRRRSVEAGKRIPERQELETLQDLMAKDYYTSLYRNIFSNERAASIGYGTASALTTIIIFFPRMMSAVGTLAKNLSPFYWLGPSLAIDKDGKVVYKPFTYNTDYLVTMDSLGKYEKIEIGEGLKTTRIITNILMAGIYTSITQLFKTVPCTDPEAGTDCYEPEDKTWRLVGAGPKFGDPDQTNTADRNSIQFYEEGKDGADGQWVTWVSYDKFLPVVAILAPLGSLYDKYWFGTGQDVTKFTNPLKLTEGEEGDSKAGNVLKNSFFAIGEILKLSSSSLTTAYGSGILADLPIAFNVGFDALKNMSSQIANESPKEGVKDEAKMLKNTTDLLLRFNPGNAVFMKQGIGAANSYIGDKPVGFVNKEYGYGAFDVVINRVLEKNEFLGFFAEKETAYNTVGIPKSFGTNFTFLPDQLVNKYIKEPFNISPTDRSYLTPEENRYANKLRTFNRFDEPLPRYPLGTSFLKTPERGGEVTVYEGLVNLVELSALSNEINKRVGKYFTENIDDTEKLSAKEYNSAASKASDIFFKQVESEVILENLLLGASKYKFTQDQEDALFKAQGSAARGLSKFIEDRKANYTESDNSELLSTEENLQKEFIKYLTKNKVKHTTKQAEELLKEHDIINKGVNVYPRTLIIDGFYSEREDPMLRTGPDGKVMMIKIVDKDKIKKWLVENNFRLKRGKLLGNVNYVPEPI